MAKKQFKAESKRLLDLMIHSIYTHREIFLRELISNASDATDKLYFQSLTDHELDIKQSDLEIQLEVDKENRTLKIIDHGIGMTKEELEKNLGTIAKSGSFDFKKENQTEDVDIIGQFGVGFYSAFMVAKKVTVYSKAYGSEEGFVWESEGTAGYTVEPYDKPEIGTEIVLQIHDNTDEDNYDEFLDSYRIQSIVKKYSDYIRYPIRMEVEKSRPKEGTKEGEAPEWETYTELETLNSMVPVWKKSKEELADDEYNNFYKEKLMDFEDPLLAVHSKTEGAATYNALLFIPAKAPYNYYSKDFEKGLQLYSSGVLIMDKCADLLPDYFSFVRGLVDSEDLSLNISREMLQHDRQLKVIAKSLERKIKNELKKLLTNEREKYEKFFEAFGLQLKFGIYNQYGANKDLLQDLLLFYSSSEQKLVTLAEYVGRMKEGQEVIYYASGENTARIDHLPQTELVKEKGYEILYFTDDVDEFAIQVMREFDGKKFQSVSDGNLDLDSEEEKKAQEEQAKENEGLLKAMTEALEGKAKEVRISKRLKSHAVCLASEGGLSIEMEKVLGAMPNGGDMKAEKILELNANHPVFAKLQKLYETDSEKLKGYADLLYTQALLIEGIPVEDPVAFSNQICELMAAE